MENITTLLSGKKSNYYTELELENAIFEYYKELEKQINIDVNSEKYEFQLKKIYFEDIMSYQNDNYLDFDIMNGIVLINGENSVGKSTIIYALMFSLWGIVGNLNNDKIYLLRNTNKLNLRTEVVISIKDDIYHIIRTADKNNSKTRKNGYNGLRNIQVKLLKKNENDELIDISKESYLETNNFINDLIGTPEIFLKTNISLQDNKDNLNYMSEKEIKDIFNSLIDTRIYKINEINNKLKKYTLDKIKQLTNSIKYYEKDSYQVIDTIENKFKNKYEKILEEKINQSELTIENKNIITEIIKNVFDLKQLEIEKEDKINKIESFNKELEIEKKNLELYNIFESCLDKINLNLMINKIEEIETEINTLLTLINTFRIKIEYNEDTIYFYKIEDENKFMINTLSGYEQIILSNVFRLILTKKYLPNINFIILDEIFACFDSKNLQSIGKLLEYMKENYKFILLITHINKLKTYKDIEIVIKKKKGISKIYLEN